MTGSIVIFLAEYFGYILMGSLLIFLLKGLKKHVFLVLQMIAAAILSRGIITEAIRFFWHRTRPFVEQNIAPLVDHSSSASFPSGHASFYFAIGTVLYFYNKKAGVLFLVGSSLIGIARIAAGLHWPSDIVVGALIGIFSGWIVYGLLKLKVNKQL